MAQLEMYQSIANSPPTILSVAINSSETQITLGNASVLPSAPNLLVIGYDTDSPETCLYTNVVGNVVTIQRGTEGIAQSFESGANVARVFTSKDYNSIINNIKDLNKQQIAMSIALS